MIQLLLILTLLTGGVLFFRSRMVRKTIRQIRLLRQSMRKEFQRLDAESAPSLAEQHAKKVSIEG